MKKLKIIKLQLIKWKKIEKIKFLLYQNLEVALMNLTNVAGKELKMLLKKLIENLMKFTQNFLMEVQLN